MIMIMTVGVSVNSLVIEIESVEFEKNEHARFDILVCFTHYCPSGSFAL